MTKNLIAIALLACAGSALAARSADMELQQADNNSAGTALVTEGIGNSGQKIAALDMQTDGKTSAFQFLVRLPKGTKALDISDCLSGLPSTHTGRCVASKDMSKVAVVVYSGSNAVLPKGMQSVGTIRYMSNAKSSIQLDKIVMGSADGRELKGSAKVVGVASKN